MAHRSNPTADAVASPREPGVSGASIRSIVLALTASLAVIAAVTTAALFAFDGGSPISGTNAAELRDLQLVAGIDPSVAVIVEGPARGPFVPVSAAMLRDLELVAGIDPSVPVIIEDSTPGSGDLVSDEMLRDLQLVAGVDPSVPVIVEDTTLVTIDGGPIIVDSSPAVGVSPPVR